MEAEEAEAGDDTNIPVRPQCEKNCPAIGNPSHRRAFFCIQMDAISGGVPNRAGIVEPTKHLGHSILRQQDHIHGFNT